MALQAGIENWLLNFFYTRIYGGTMHRSWLGANKDQTIFKKRCTSGVVHVLYQGVLYFINIIHCHATCKNIVLFTPIRKMWPYQRNFSPKS
jgi:hypothetical protein